MTDGDNSSQGEKIFQFDKLKQKHGRAPYPNSTLPRLFADHANPDKVIADLKALLAPSHEVFDRGVLVRIVDGVRASPDPLNRIPRRLSGLLPGLVLCNFARGA